jgi:hypothetical protein
MFSSANEPKFQIQNQAKPVFSYRSEQGSRASFKRSPTKKAGKVRKERGEVGRRGRLVEGEGVRGRAN